MRGSTGERTDRRRFAERGGVRDTHAGKRARIAGRRTLRPVDIPKRYITVEAESLAMKLASPTDFEILEALSDGRRNNAVNLAVVLDKNRSYVNTRLPVLADYELVHRVGPSPRSGLYEITDRGLAVTHLADRYDDPDVDFEALVDEWVETHADDE